jgi:DNA-binding transcriptional LysR family regulator
MKLRQIEVFHAVMITGSTVAAAEMLNVTQPAISTTLKRMQDELGLMLFSSASGRLIPTPEARALFTQAHAIQEDVGSLRRLARLLAEGKAGALRLGVVPAVSEGILAQAIAQIRTQAPEVVLSVDVLNSHDLVNRLIGGRIDLACVFGDDHGPPLKTLFSISVPLVCVGPADALSTAERVTPAQLAQIPLAAMRPTDPIGRLLSNWGGRTQMSPVVELRSSRGVLALARCGVASGVVDWLTLSDLGASGLSHRFLDPPLAIDLRILCASAGQPPIALERAAGALAGAISERIAPKAN